MPVQAWTRIRAAIISDYQSLYGKGGYRATSDIWGLSAGTTWRIINVENYYPKSKKIQRILLEKAKERGIEISKRKRMRVEIDPEISVKDLEKIRLMSVESRTRILLGKEDLDDLD